MFDAAAKLGLPVKLHADQLSDLGGAALAARYRALSADHLEYTSDDGVAAMAKAGTVAVLLPGAFYFLRETKLPPIAQFRAAGVPIAIATDSNPGSAPVTSIAADAQHGLHAVPHDAGGGAGRRHAPRARGRLGMAETHGTLEVGKAADFAIWNIERPAELCYRIGFNPCAGVVPGGERSASSAFRRPHSQNANASDATSSAAIVRLKMRIALSEANSRTATPTPAQNEQLGQASSANTAATISVSARLSWPGV